jgi:hypothetical protein
LRDLAKWRAGQVEPANRGVVIGSRQQGLALGFCQAGPCFPGTVEQR